VISGGVRGTRLLLSVAVLVGSAGVAQAQDSSVAERLFREGKRLMGEKKIAEACKAFEGSYRKDPAVTTLMNLADCREKNLQFATAWGYFLDVVRIARDRSEAAAFGPIASGRAQKLEAKLSYLIVNVPADADVEGLQLTRNGAVIDPAEWNTDIPVDGGEYVVEGKAPGYEAWSTKVVVGPANDKKSVNVPRFRARPASGAGDVTEPGPATPTPPDGGAPAPETPEPGRPGGGGRTRALALMGGGGALVLGGLAVGYLAQQKWWDAENVCGADHVCASADERAEADALVEDARLRGNISTILVGAGVVAGGVGTFLFLRSRKGNVTPVVTERSAALVVRGRF
jgi:hypothetical protein